MSKGFKLAGRAIDPATRTILSGGRATRLRPVCWDVLTCLVERRGSAVSIETLLETIWTDQVGNPAYVRKAIHEIRAALDDGEGRVIRTVPKVGYVIEAEVEVRPTGDTSDPTPLPPGETLVYGRLSSGDYGEISRRLRRRRRDSGS